MERVLSPLEIRDVVLPNRVVRTAHVTVFGEAGRITDRFIAYRRARAEGGVGLTILEGGPERLRAAGVEVRLRSAITQVASGRATVLDLASGEAREAEADWVVMIGYGTGAGAAFGEAAQGRALAIVGDALSPRFLPTLHKGHRAGLRA